MSDLQAGRVVEVRYPDSPPERETIVQVNRYGGATQLLTRARDGQLRLHHVLGPWEDGPGLAVSPDHLADHEEVCRLVVLGD